MKEKFSLWNILFIQFLKRDWKKNILWILGIGIFAAGFVPAFKEIGMGQGLAGMYETMQNPAMISMVGPTPITNSIEYTLGALYANEMLLFCGMLAMIISALHVISHTRKEEDLALGELVRSFRVGRQANSIAIIIETLLINILLGLIIGGVMVSFGVDSITANGAFLFGASIALAGIIGAVLALVIAQIMPTSSGTTSTTLSSIGLLYILRAGSDVSNINLSMLNPLGWTYLSFPFTKNNWLPLIYGCIFCIVMVIIAFVLEGNRDMGGGYLPEKEGRSNAKKSLLSVHGLLFKRNKGTILAWLITFIILGAAYGSIYGDMQVFLESNELMKQMFASTNISIESSFTSTIMLIMVGLVAILPIVIINKLFNEEARLHLSQIYSTKVTRSQMYWTTIIIAVIAGVVGILFSATGLAGSAIIALKGNSSLHFLDFLVAGLNFFPAVLFFISLAALALGWFAKLGKVVYVYLGYTIAINYFGGILNLPDWFSKTAIMSWSPRMPMETFEPIVFISITIISIVFIFLGYIGYKNRDLLEGS